MCLYKYAIFLKILTTCVIIHGSALEINPFQEHPIMISLASGDRDQLMQQIHEKITNRENLENYYIAKDLYESLQGASLAVEWFQHHASEKAKDLKQTAIRGINRNVKNFSRFAKRYVIIPITYSPTIQSLISQIKAKGENFPSKVEEKQQYFEDNLLLHEGLQAEIETQNNDPILLHYTKETILNLKKILHISPESDPYATKYKLWIEKLSKKEVSFHPFYDQIIETTDIPSAWRQRFLRLLMTAKIIRNDLNSDSTDLFQELTDVHSVENFLICCLNYGVRQRDFNKFIDSWPIIQKKIVALNKAERERFYSETTPLSTALYEHFPDFRNQVENINEPNIFFPPFEMSPQNDLSYYRNRAAHALARYEELNALRPLNMDRKPDFIKAWVEGPIYAFLAKQDVELKAWKERFQHPSSPSYIKNSPSFLSLLEELYTWSDEEVPESLKASLNRIEKPKHVLVYLSEVYGSAVAPFIETSVGRDKRIAVVDALLSEKNSEVDALQLELSSINNLENQFISLLVTLAMDMESLDFNSDFLKIQAIIDAYGPLKKKIFHEETDELVEKIYARFPLIKYHVMALRKGPFQKLATAVVKFVAESRDDLDAYMTELKHIRSVENACILQALYTWLGDVDRAKKLKKSIKTTNYVNAIKEAADLVINPFLLKQREENEKIRVAYEAELNRSILNKTKAKRILVSTKTVTQGNEVSVQASEHIEQKESQDSSIVAEEASPVPLTKEERVEIFLRDAVWCATSDCPLETIKGVQDALKQALKNIKGLPHIQKKSILEKAQSYEASIVHSNDSIFSEVFLIKFMGKKYVEEMKAEKILADMREATIHLDQKQNPVLEHQNIESMTLSDPNMSTVSVPTFTRRVTNFIPEGWIIFRDVLYPIRPYLRQVELCGLIKDPQFEGRQGFVVWGVFLPVEDHL